MRPNIKIGSKVLHTGLELIGTVVQSKGYYYTVDLSHDGRMLIVHCLDEELVPLDAKGNKRED